MEGAANMAFEGEGKGKEGTAAVATTRRLIYFDGLFGNGKTELCLRVRNHLLGENDTSAVVGERFMEGHESFMWGTHPAEHDSYVMIAKANEIHDVLKSDPIHLLVQGSPHLHRCTYDGKCTETKSETFWGRMKSEKRGLVERTFERAEEARVIWKIVLVGSRKCRTERWEQREHSTEERVFVQKHQDKWEAGFEEYRKMLADPQKATWVISSAPCAKYVEINTNDKTSDEIYTMVLSELSRMEDEEHAGMESATPMESEISDSASDKDTEFKKPASKQFAPQILWIKKKADTSGEKKMEPDDNERADTDDTGPDDSAKKME